MKHFVCVWILFFCLFVCLNQSECNQGESFGKVKKLSGRVEYMYVLFLKVMIMLWMVCLFVFIFERVTTSD